MEYYFLENNVKQGPFSLDELKIKNLTPNTLIWRQGMQTWQPIDQTEEFREILGNIPPVAPAPFTSVAPILPKTWLVESILVTCLCCVPFGVLGIINSTKIEALYNNRQYDEAKRYSDLAKKWCLWGLGLSAVFFTLYIIGLVVVGMFTSLFN